MAFDINSSFGNPLVGQIINVDKKRSLQIFFAYSLRLVIANDSIFLSNPLVFRYRKNSRGLPTRSYLFFYVDPVLTVKLFLDPS